MVGPTILLVLIFLAVFAPLLTKHSLTAIDLRAYRLGSSVEHPLGTDSPWRDVFRRLLYAGRVSLSVGLVAVSIYTAIGVVLGTLIPRRVGRWVDHAPSGRRVMISDDYYYHPRLGAWSEHLQRHDRDCIARLAADPAALARRVSLVTRTEDVIGARAVGCSDLRVIFRYLLPNATAPVLVAATFGIAYAILIEAGLRFIGLGVQPPTPSWGNMLTDAQSLTVLESMPWLWLPPGLMIALAVLSINFIGDGLRDALDPYLSNR